MVGMRLQGKHLVNVGQVHFKTMFCLVDLARHAFEVPFFLDRGDERGVDGEVAEGRRVCVAGRGGGAGEVVVVGGAEEEDAFAVDGSDWVQGM
jgi:hypothetical protein